MTEVDVVTIFVEERSEPVSVSVTTQSSPVTISTSSTIEEVAIDVEQPITEVVVSPTQIVGMPGPEGPQGPAGPPGSGGPTLLSVENRSGQVIFPGQALAAHPSGAGVVLADPSALGTRAIGLAATGADPGFALLLQTEDILELDDWSAATGSPPLAALARLYLSESGQLTPTPPTTGILQVIGEPVSAKKLAIRIAEPIRRT